MNPTIIIAGGGFAGITALDTLHRSRGRIPQDIRIILIDKKDTFDFLPMIPDVLAGWLRPERISVSLELYCKARGCKFIKGDIQTLDTNNKHVKVNNTNIPYEFLILATGGVPNFFGNKSAETNCYTLNRTEDALEIRKAITQKGQTHKPFNIVIIGGGYTGIEAALNSHFFTRRMGLNAKISIVEKAQDVITVVPAWMRSMVRAELDRLGIDLHINSALSSYENDTVTLDSQRVFDNALCIWTAGMKIPSYLEALDTEIIRSRLKVRADLRLMSPRYQNIYAAGDSAAFIDPKTNEPLRMAIMFAIGQAKIAAHNIIRSLRNERPVPFKPNDLGFLIPLVYHNAPGIVLGKPVKGLSGYILHYFMCLYRSKSSKVPGILKDFCFSRIFNLSHN